MTKNHRHLLDDPATHEPRYHEFSLLEHCRRVIAAAERLASLTGIDVVRAAILHDVGKLVQLHRAGAWRQGIFIGHERISATIARGFDCTRQESSIIEHHNVSHAHRADRVLEKLCNGDADLLKRLLVLAAADTAGKGWTEIQRVQRPEVATKFRTICELAGIDAAFPDTLEHAILTW